MSARRPTARRESPLLDDADDPGLAEAAVDRDAPALERARDEVRGAVLLEAQLRMGVDVAPYRGDRRGVGQDRFDHAHAGGHPGRGGSRDGSGSHGARGRRRILPEPASRRQWPQPAAGLCRM
jgi:hypothetical protein